MNHTTQDIPYGYCACGCGQKTKIAPRSNQRLGYVKGEPFRFLHGHRERIPLAVRFWQHVTPGTIDECWLWTAAIHKTGYGVIGKSGSRGYELAHRASWEIHFGPIPDGLQVLHKCDVNYPPGDITNRRCVNPYHLWLGTNQENNADMMAKGRHSHPTLFGEQIGTAKLTASQVIEIRALAAQGIYQKEIAKRVGITKAHVSSIVLRKRWKHI
jgi:hypothetical protein